MKKKKATVATAIVLALMISCTLPVLATQSKPYGTYSAYRTSGFSLANMEETVNSMDTANPEGLKYYAHALITKCSCNPVDNYLCATVEAQYNKGGSYLWLGPSSDFGTNRQQAYICVSTTYYMNYCKGSFKAKCSGGSLFMDTVEN